MIWIGLVIYPILIGGILAVKYRNIFGFIGSVVLPFLGLYLLSLIDVYMMPYRGGGAPMLGVIYVIFGPIITLISIFTFLLIGAMESGET